MTVIADQGNGSGTPAAPPPPAAPSSTRDIVKSDPAAFNAAVGRVEAPADAPAPAAQPPAKPDGAAKGEPPKVETKAPGTSTPPPAKVPYTKEEFAAFEGNYHRREFDWDRWPTELQEAKTFAKAVASGYGKRHADLDKLKADLDAASAAAKQPPATETEKQSKPPAAGADWKSGVDKLLTEDEETSANGFAEMLRTPRGRQILAEHGFQIDPAEREAISDLVRSRTINMAVAAIGEGEDAPFPQYVADEAFRGEVNEIIRSDKKLRAMAEGRDPEEATYAFAAACGMVAAQRLKTAESSFKAKETALAERETALKAAEAKLKAEIEASNRSEPVTPAVSGQPSGAAKGGPLSTREIVRGMGPIPAP